MGETHFGPERIVVRGRVWWDRAGFGGTAWGWRSSKVFRLTSQLKVSSYSELDTSQANNSHSS